ncbi:TPA: hypothetical protein U1C23_000374 [Streptococcus suis]|nr:hypothetical protein [Streptococcus suis]
MKKMNRTIIKYTTTITDNLYYLLPLELLLGFLWGISWGSLWIINQVSSILPWDAWSQIQDIFQIGQNILSQTIIIVTLIYFLAHIILCFIWIKEDKLFNFFRTVNQLRKIRKQMQSNLSNEISKEYASIVRSIRCAITQEYILVIIPQAEISEVDTILREKISFLNSYMNRNYRKLYMFSPPDDTACDNVIYGERKTHD